MNGKPSNSHEISINVKTLYLHGSGGVLRFEPFSFEMNGQHPHCCVTGPSGSGKTTFFKSLVPRFVRDWEEYEDIQIEVSITRDRLDFFETNGRIGYAAQTPFFIAHKTVHENLILPFKWSKTSPPNEDELHELISDFRLDRIIDRTAYKLSAGEKQRLNLARMFIARPEIAIIDECFSSMDEELAELIASVIIDKYASNMKILVTGHRKSDLSRFLPKCLRFSYSDTVSSEPLRTVIVENEDEISQ